jgi:hypothetical protein
VPLLEPPLGRNDLQFVPPAANGIFVAEGHAFVATGANGVHEIDARNVSNMVDLGELAPGQGVDAVDVILSQLPGQSWVVALEASGDVAFIKRDNTVTRYERCSEDPKAAECFMELERFDPTRSGKDPSFDPVANVFDNIAIDPSAATFFRLNSTILAGGGRRLLRPTYFEQIGTLSGRRYRDSFMPGSGVLSTSVMKRMRDIFVCEIEGSASTNPSGLDGLGYSDGPGSCTPFTGAGFKRSTSKVASCQPGALSPGLQQMVCDEPPPQHKRQRSGDKAVVTPPRTRIKLPSVGGSIAGTAS